MKKLRSQTEYKPQGVSPVEMPCFSIFVFSCFSCLLQVLVFFAVFVFSCSCCFLYVLCCRCTVLIFFSYFRALYTFHVLYVFPVIQSLRVFRPIFSYVTFKKFVQIRSFCAEIENVCYSCEHTKNAVNVAKKVQNMR